MTMTMKLQAGRSAHHSAGPRLHSSFCNACAPCVHLLASTTRAPLKPSPCRRARRVLPCASLAPAVAAAAATLVTAFLPWSGCDSGGFYSTGVKPGHGCQPMYQPSAAAEARAVAALRQAQAPSTSSSADRVGSAAPAQASTGTSSRAGLGSGASSRNSMLAPSSDSLASANADTRQPQQQVDSHKTAADALVRQILEEDLRGRNKELVDAAWQSLE